MWRPLIWRRVECYYGQVGLNQAQISTRLSSVKSSHAKYIWAEAEVWGHKIYLDGSDQWSLISLNNFYTQQSFFLSTSPTTWMFLVYPIRPHFLGHNFLSLNPSISDKKNIQTLRGDSALTLCRGPVVRGPIPSFIFCPSMEISKYCRLLMLKSCTIGSGMIYQQ